MVHTGWHGSAVRVLAVQRRRAKFRSRNSHTMPDVVRCTPVNASAVGTDRTVTGAYKLQAQSQV